MSKYQIVSNSDERDPNADLDLWKMAAILKFEKNPYSVILKFQTKLALIGLEY